MLFVAGGCNGNTGICGAAALGHQAVSHAGEHEHAHFKGAIHNFHGGRILPRTAIEHCCFLLGKQRLHAGFIRIQAVCRQDIALEQIANHGKRFNRLVIHKAAVARKPIFGFGN